MDLLLPLLNHYRARFVVRVARNDRGASLVEYALLVALIAVICIGAVSFLGSSTSANINGAASAI